MALAILQVGATAAAGHNQPERTTLGAAGVALLLAGPAALLVRRRWPEAALAVALAADLAYWLTDYPRGPAGFPSLIFAFVYAVLAGRRVFAWGTLAVGYVAFTVLPPLLDQESWSVGRALGLAAWLLVLGTGAEILRNRRERQAELAHVQAEEARRRASDERLLIARELHDVLAHNISLINVQAGVALHLLDERPDQARPALAAIKDASKEALGELRSVLDVLRRGDDGANAPLAPTAGLRDLPGLVERTRAAGLDVALDVVGDERPVPAGVDLAAFRIVQEALTNVVRHSGGASAQVRLDYGDHQLTVQVDDDGTGAPVPPRDDPGRGIAGMRERVQALNGTFAAGPRPGRGFRVRARFPIGAGGTP
ncbi:MAG TPA: sensor histidine kinase [Acidimicrobiales bacterium]|nr:sensor histidine kinase [Acidimicrobiales bacterium]